MSRRLWRCRNPHCRTPHGAILGRLKGIDGLILEPGVERVSVYLDTRRVSVHCPECGEPREFRGQFVSLGSPVGIET